jgi:chromosome segregation ATPase
MNNNAKIKDNGKQEIFLDENEIESIEQKTDQEYGKILKETEKLKRDADEIHNSLFGINSTQNSINEAEDVRNDLRKELSKISENYKLIDFTKFDLEKNSSDSQKKVIGTTMLEKLIYQICSIDDKLKSKYQKSLQDKYLPKDPKEKLDLILSIRNEQIENSLKNYIEIETRVKSTYNEISEDRKNLQSKFNNCELLVDKTNKLLDSYNMRLNKIKEYIKKASNTNKDAIVINLFNEKDQIESDINESNSKLYQVERIMRKLNLQIDGVYQREEKLMRYIESNSQKRNDILIIKDLLNYISKQYDLSYKMTSLENNSAELDKSLLSVQGIIKDLSTLNEKVDNELLNLNSSFSDMTDKLLNENSKRYNKSKDDSYIRDPEKIKTDIQKLIDERRRKNYERIGYFIK